MTRESRIVRLLPALLLAIAVAGCTQNDPPAASERGQLRVAAVAMPDRHGAAVSEAVIRSGGNAVDAAIAAGFALAVTFPEAGNIGGGGFMLIRMDGESSFLDYRETAPLAAHRDMFLDADGEVIENASLIGHRAAGVPGTVAGFWAAHQRFGTKPWRELVAPAVALAEHGFIAPQSLVDHVQSLRDWFGDSTNFFEYFGSMRAGDVFRQPQLAQTLRRIAETGPQDFYHGETARLLVRQMQSGEGLIGDEDLQRYAAVWREPLSALWRGYEIVSAPPPSSGGFAVIQLLKTKDYLHHFFDGVPHNSAQYVHLVAEMEKRVFADRAEYLGDPDYVDVPIRQLLAEEYIQRRAREVDPQRISSVDGVAPGLESHDTTHYSILDGMGNAVSNTYTINWDFGSGVVVQGAGFLLNNEMDDFSVKPGVPNVYGVVGNTANEIQPGKRMLSSMSPTILLEDEQVKMVIGTPGGSTIFTSVFQAIVNIEDFGMSPADAVDAGRFHHQLLPADLVTYSPSRPLPGSVMSALGERGYRLEPHSWEFGNVQIVLRDGDRVLAASDPRGRGDSRVFEYSPGIRD
ncbi:MAG: gamma-glutamyltransferase [Gammaproteobacteria bacterium]|nr:gamma-glutamyltransferase [Gammaproteobacteria bacterium]